MRPNAAETTGSDLLLTQEDLRWSEKRYRKIFEHTKDGIIVLDAQQHIILDLNQSMAVMFGFERVELLSKPITEVWPDKINQVIELAQTLIDGSQVSGMELDCKTRNGKSLQVEISASIIDFDNWPSILCIVRDNTERKLAEDALQKSEQRFRSFFEHAPEYCYMVGPEGKIMDVNQAATNALGYERDELIGKPLKSLYASESQEKAQQLFDKWMETGELVNEELSIVTKTDDYRQILLSTSTVTDDRGKLMHSISIQKDITELKQAQEYLTRSAKLSALGQLAAGIAHEINNPLNIIILSMDAALHQADNLSSNVRREIVTSMKAAVRASKIVTNILEFARERPLHRDLCNLHGLIDKVLNLSSADALSAKVTIQRKYMTKAPQLELDAIQIQQVFMNMTINAIQAMPEGGSLSIRTRLVDDGSKIAVEFKDTGVGIPDDTKANIFDPFFTTKSEGVGIGLGLSISYGLVEAHGGEIKVHSRVGKGTTFTILFPTDPSEAQNHPANLLEN